MVGFAGSSMCIVHADVTLTQSRVKVKGHEVMTVSPLWGDFWLRAQCAAFKLISSLLQCHVWVTEMQALVVLIQLSRRCFIFCYSRVRLQIISQKDDHCWIGELNGLRGWFPAKFVELLDERSKSYSSAGDDSVTETITDIVRGVYVFSGSLDICCTLL